MLSARQAKEVIIEVRNEIGILHQVSKIIAEKGINIIGIVGNVAGENAVLRILTDDNVRVADALRENRYAPIEADVLVAELPNKPGILESLTEQLARTQIDIRYIASTVPVNYEKCLLVLSTSDDQQAMVALNGGR